MKSAIIVKHNTGYINSDFFPTIIKSSNKSISEILKSEIKEAKKQLFPDLFEKYEIPKSGILLYTTSNFGMGFNFNNITKEFNLEIQPLPDPDYPEHLQTKIAIGQYENKPLYCIEWMSGTDLENVIIWNN